MQGMLRVEPITGEICVRNCRKNAQNTQKLAHPIFALFAPFAAIGFMTFETVQYELDGGVATVTMNRPDALNALSLQLTHDLDAAFRQAISDGARAVVLTGNGRAFCAGGDLREMR